MATPFEEADLVQVALAVLVDHGDRYHACALAGVGAIQDALYVQFHAVVVIDCRDAGAYVPLVVLGEHAGSEAGENGADGGCDFHGLILSSSVVGFG
jgi:hypothetical protein